MKFGITTGGVARFGDARYEKAHTYGFSAVDFAMMNTDTPIYQCTEEELCTMMQKERALAEQSDVSFYQVHGPWCWPPVDDTEESRARKMEHCKRSMRAAALLGAKCWVIHPLMPFGVEDLECGKEKETWQINLDFFRALLPTAHELDVTICLENMPFLKFSISTPEDILRMIREIDDDHFKMCLDTGHVGVFPQLSLADEIRRVGNVLCAVHIHDNDARRDLHLLPTFGRMDWSDFGKALREIGFAGVFSFECTPPRTLPEDIYVRLLQIQSEIGQYLLTL